VCRNTAISLKRPGRGFYSPGTSAITTPRDCLFAHVWLGLGNSRNLPCEPYLGQFGDFVLAFRPRRVFLAHLYEIGRTVEEMWTYTHAGLAMDALLARDPGLDVVIPRLGHTYDL
jgi:hypothetical protein